MILTSFHGHIGWCIPSYMRYLFKIFHPIRLFGILLSWNSSLRLLDTNALLNMCIVNVFFSVHSFCSIVSTMSFVKQKFGISMNFSLKVFFFLFIVSYEIFVYKTVMKIISYVFFLKFYNFIFYIYINGPFTIIMLCIVWNMMEMYICIFYTFSRTICSKDVPFSFNYFGIFVETNW